MEFQLKGPAAELPKRVHNLLTITRVNANVGVGSTYLPASARIDEQSLAEMQEVSRCPLLFRISSIPPFILKQVTTIVYYVASGPTTRNRSNCQVSKCIEEGFQGHGDNYVRGNRHDDRRRSWKAIIEEAINIILLVASINTNQSFSPKACS